MSVLYKDDHVIIAQCTPQGSGAIALLRISGLNALTLVDAIAELPHGKKLETMPTHTIQYGWVVDKSGARVDQVLFLLMKAPHTFTGQNTVEITCHNNQFIIQKIIACAIQAGARLAEPGEFTQRAFQNGKLDLTQAEAINEIIHANTSQALKAALAQVDGSFSYWISVIEQDLLSCLAYSEASFEFLDDEIEFAPQMKEKIWAVLRRIASMKSMFDQQKQIRSGIRIVFVGCVNAGKSSLFNALLGSNRAIVSDIAGTTRDVVESGVYQDGLYWTLLDTAGLRLTDDVIEKAGIERSHDEAVRADVIVLVQDGSRMLSAQEKIVYQDIYARYGNKIIMVRSKCDASELFEVCVPCESIDVSVHDAVSIERVRTALQAKVEASFASEDSPFLVNQRQYQLMCRLEQELQQIEQQLDARAGYEVISIHLQDALASVSELSGKTISEKGMDTIFRQFCVGK